MLPAINIARVCHRKDVLNGNFYHTNDPTVGKFVIVCEYVIACWGIKVSGCGSNFNSSVRIYILIIRTY